MKNIRLAVVSDTHREYSKLQIPKCDIFIHCGDIDLDSYLDLNNFNEWLSSIPSKHNICIGGNHDIYLANKGFGTIERELYNTIYLENCGVKLMGLNFWGSPITPQFNDWVFMAERGRDIQRYWDLIPQNIDVLIVHGPPSGILDQATLANGEYGDHLGCFNLEQTIARKLNPKAVLFGHIHGSGGQTLKKENTVYVNASVMNETYDVVDQPIIIDISK